MRRIGEQAIRLLARLCAQNELFFYIGGRKEKGENETPRPTGQLGGAMWLALWASFGWMQKVESVFGERWEGNKNKKDGFRLD